MDESAVRVVTRAIDKVRRELERHSELERRNALLSLLAEDLVLPCPSVALLQVECASEMTLTSAAFFRSVDPVGDVGEVALAPIETGVAIAPWSLQDVRLVGNSAGVVGGIEFEVLRPDSTNPPPFSIYSTSNDPLLGWGLANAVWASDDGQVELLSPAPHGTRHVGRGGIGALGILEQLTSTLMRFRLSGLCGAKKTIVLKGRFVEPIELAEIPGSEFRDCFKVNVLPVWNALPCIYPAFDRFAANISDHHNVRLHPLTTESLGDSWTACRVLRVRLARRRHHVFPSSSEVHRNYELCLVPSDSVRGAENNLFDVIPAVVLGPELVEEIEALNDRVIVEFLATRGAITNGIQPGTRFQLFDANGDTVAEVSGKTLCATIAGSDGMLSTENCVEAAVLLKGTRQRTIDDVIGFTKARFGEYLSLRDPADLTRFATGTFVKELCLRVSVKPPYRDRVSRLAIIAAYNEAVEEYCRPNDIGPIVVVDDIA